MGLRCSLLGHDYGESEIEREREEQGNEVVVTVREFQECARCGDQQVVSENKEVTAIEEPEPTPEPIASREQAESGEQFEPERQPEPKGQSESVSMSESGDIGAEIVSETEAPAESEPTPEPGRFNDDDFEPPQSAEEDDGVILDDDEEEDEQDTERGHGEWPDPEDTNVDDAGVGTTEWPNTGMEDEGFSAEVGDGGRTDLNFGGGLTPESAPEADDDTEVVEAEPREDTGFVRTTRPEPQTETGFTRAHEAPKPDQASESNPNANLVCPECGELGGAAAGSSLRAGDICPECRRGYLSEQE
ncbi:oxidoreductase [Haladaptatus pallidirubidus]|uniref:Oxidoreductase n=1 Tax=Haladaptatus pallidirubidus TaxID=1008152 RepID=A0AAV3UM11_9EURY|nr:oxidoreductase [Haladaptatus pallidirubidus]